MAMDETSLDHAEQEQALSVSPALITELERRWSWELVRQDLALE